MNLPLPQSSRQPLMKTVEIQPASTLKNFLIIFVTLLVGAGIGIGAFFLTIPFIKSTKQIVRPLAVSKQISSPTPGKPLLIDTFQEILKKNCIKVEDNSQNATYAIAISALPVITSQASAPVASCIGESDTYYSIFSVNKPETKYTFYIYDKNSKELGHGGYPLLGQVGTFFLNKDGIDYSFFLVLESRSTIGTEPVSVRAIKTIKLSNGESIYASLTVNSIDEKDQRLLTILNKYALSLNGKKDIDGTKIKQINADIKAGFFADLHTMQSPEKEVIATLNSLLSTVSGK